MKKLLFLTHCYPVDINDKRGHFFLPVIKRLRELDIQVIVITPWWCGEHSIYKEKTGFYGEKVIYFRWEGKRFENMSLLNPISMISIVRFIVTWRNKIKSVLKNTGEVTSVLAAWGFPAGILFRFLNLKNVRTAIWWLGSDFNSLNHRMLSSILKFILGGAHENWTNSHRMALALKNKQSDGDISFVPLLTNHTVTNSQSELKSNSLKRVITIGRLERVIGIDIGIKAVSKLLNQGYEFQYNIVGDGSQKKHFQSLIDNHQEYIHLLGYLSDDELSIELNKSDFVMIPSRMSGMPLVFFEALAAGKPVIATDVGDIQKCVSGSTLGLVSHPENVIELSNNIKKALSGELRFDENRTSLIFKEYSIDNTISSIKSLFEYSTANKNKVSF